jgi:hypothetical protein
MKKKTFMDKDSMDGVAQANNLFTGIFKITPSQKIEQILVFPKFLPCPT